jgi:phenylalanyl-tRNA synthetase alpha chain
MDLAAYEGRINGAKTPADLRAIELELFGRKQGVLASALKELGNLSPEQRRVRGEELNGEKLRLQTLIDKKQAALASANLERLAQDDAIDITLPLPARRKGHLHPIPEFLRKVEDVFASMGFDVAEGPEIEHQEMNFTLVNMPEEHAARDSQATFVVAGDGNWVLRTHTSPVQIRYMRSHTPPFRMICPGRVYRKDADATHSPMFHQFEGLMVGSGISLANMKAVMATALRALLSPTLEFRFRTSYFPFVEPGLEVDVRFAAADGGTGRWLEVAGCGMVHPQVLKNGNVNPKLYQGFAFGFGVERLVMIKYDIPDLRLLYEGDLRFLQQF